MRRGIVSKIVNSFGASWGRIRPEGESREVFFNASTLLNASEFPTIAVGQPVEFDEEPDRANGSHAVRVSLIAAEAGIG